MNTELHMKHKENTHTLIPQPLMDCQTGGIIGL